ncbi:hypothetical protein V8E53_011990 [Lactarius tabidus]
MPALIPVDNTLGSLFIGTALSSIIYGVTLLQVYSYYNSHCSRDKWPLKSLVALLMLVDSANLVFTNHTTYYIAVTNFGDYSPFQVNMPWSLFAIALSGSFLEVSVQHFYAYRIYILSGRSPYLPATISVISLTAFGMGMMLSVKGLEHIKLHVAHFRNIYTATMSCLALCDVLITIGMVYTVLRNRVPFPSRSTNNVLNLLAIYAINYGTLNLVFTLSDIILLVVCQNTLIYLVPAFIVVRLYFCSFMAILNTRDNLRATLDRQEIVLGTIPTFTVSDTPGTCGVQVTTESRSNAAVSKTLPPIQVASYGYTSFSGSTVWDGEKYPVSPVPAILTGRDKV